MTGSPSRRWAALALCSSLTLLVACSSAPDVPVGREGPSPTAGSPDVDQGLREAAEGLAGTGAEERAATPRRRLAVVAVSVDGLMPAALEALPRRATDAYARLARSGASTVNARTAVELTVTLPNHTGMLTGRRVDADAGGHGVRINTSTSKRVDDFAGGYVASVFDVLHDHGYYTGLFAAKDKFDLFDRTWSAGPPDEVGPDQGTDKLDEFVVEEDNADLVSAALRRIAPLRRGLVFVHLSAPDKAGHASGWMSRPYLEAVASTNREVGRLIRAVDARNARGRSTVLLLTADHGGSPGTEDHSRSDDPANYVVPFFAYGAGVPQGADLYELNPDRADPGTGRPGYSGVQPVRNGDLANGVLALFGLGPVPGSLVGTEDPLRVTGR